MGYTKQFQTAISLLDAGRGVEGEDLLSQAVERAKTNAPSIGQNAVARAFHELGTFFATMRDWTRAIDAYQSACALVPPSSDRQGLRDHMTHLMNLGELLVLSDRLDEAEHCLLRGLSAREQFYGTHHPGYAFGLEPLVSLRCKQSRLTEAAVLAQSLCDNLAFHQHPRLAFARMLRVEVAARKGLLTDAYNNIPFSDEDISPKDIFPKDIPLKDTSLDDTATAFAGCDAWSLPEILDVIEAALDRAHLLTTEPHIADALLELMLAHLDPRLDCSQPERVTLLSACADIAKTLGDLPRAATRLEQLVAHAESANNPSLQVETLQALALLLQDLNRTEEAHRIYTLSFQIACDANLSLVLQAYTARNLGLFLETQSHIEQAETWLRDALELARDGSDLDNAAAFGRCATALGVFLQHHTPPDESPDEAAALLHEALQHLNPCDPEALTAQSHLTALRHGESCGCERMASTWGDTLQELISPYIPPDLISHIDMTPDGTANVILSRQALPSEIESLDRALRHAQQRLMQFSRMR